MSRKARCLLSAVCVALLVACAGEGGGPVDEGAGSWNGEVRVYGALREIFHEGQIDAKVSLEALLPSGDLYAVGALADLAGEITIVGGRAYLSQADKGDQTRTEMVSESDAGAALLVASSVPQWRGVTTEAEIRFEQIDEAIAGLAVSAGMNLDERFPFLIEGEVRELAWHVIDGSRLKTGSTSRKDHLAAAIRGELKQVSATLLGFYSRGDQGVFTHRGSQTHIHCVIDEPRLAGHVDHVLIPAGTTIRFPVKSE